MKKSLILTSILALAACGGGHHGGGNGIDAPVVPDSGMRVSSETRESNQKITKMASEILIAKDGISPSIVRAASVVSNGKEYEAYNLDDVTFTMSEITDTADLDLIKIEIDDKTGEINGVKMSHKGEWGDKIERTGDKDFTSSDKKIEVEMLGDLTYADFGYVQVTDLEEGEEWHTALAGGYEHFNINKDNMADKMVFNGRAVGGISRENGGYDDDTAELIASKKLDTGANGATLTFDGGSETLKMNFNYWYTVTVSKDANKDTANIKFDADGKTIDDDLKFQHTEYADFNKKTYGMGENGIIGRYETTFYGENNNAAETTGIVSVRETTGIVDNNVNDVSELSFSSAFGGKKQ